MSEVRYSLCPRCDACPEVVVAPDRVTIGETGNEVTLSIEEWNELVAAIQSGKLNIIAGPRSDTPACDCDCGCECCN